MPFLLQVVTLAVHGYRVSVEVIRQVNYANRPLSSQYAQDISVA